MNNFIECTQIGNDGERYRKLISISQIISVTEIEDRTYIQMEHDPKGRIRIGIHVAESFDKLRSLILKP